MSEEDPTGWIKLAPLVEKKSIKKAQDCLISIEEGG